jgi:hypothetical protein
VRGRGVANELAPRPALSQAIMASSRS